MPTTTDLTVPASGGALKPRRWRTVEQIAETYPFTGPAIRMLIVRSRPHFNSRGEWVEGNGLADAICQPGGKGGKVLIDEIAFALWLERWAGRTDGEVAQAADRGAREVAHAA